MSPSFPPFSMRAMISLMSPSGNKNILTTRITKRWHHNCNFSNHHQYPIHFYYQPAISVIQLPLPFSATHNPCLVFTTNTAHCHHHPPLKVHSFTCPPSPLLLFLSFYGGGEREREGGRGVGRKVTQKDPCAYQCVHVPILYAKLAC
jgi:hypothetical protein